MSVFKIVTDTIIAYIKYAKYLLLPIFSDAKLTKRHLLLLAWAYPPDISGGVYRPMSVVHAATRLGWRVTIISGPVSSSINMAGTYLEKGVHKDARIIRLQPSKLIPSYKLFAPKINGGFLNLLETIELAYKVLNNDQPSVILASGPPFHNFVAARKISKIFNKPYVLDYRDEWTECPFDFVELGNMDRYFEKKCIKDADEIIFTTYSHFLHQKNCFDFLDPNKATVIPNGWTPDDIPDMLTINPLGKVDIRLAFVGFLSEHTLPRDFLNLLQTCLTATPDLVDRLRIAFVGAKSNSAIAQLREFEPRHVIEVLDVVQKPVALKIMQEADGLILINEPRLNRYIPGKLYDYISMRTPILVYGVGGEVERIVKKLNAGIIVPINQPQILNAALLDLKNKKKNLYSSDVDNWLALHTRKILSEKIIDVLNFAENRSISS